MLKKTCPKCGGVVELDETKYIPHINVTMQCRNCDTNMEFEIPEPNAAPKSETSKKVRTQKEVINDKPHPPVPPISRPALKPDILPGSNMPKAPAVSDERMQMPQGYSEEKPKSGNKVMIIVIAAGVLLGLAVTMVILFGGKSSHSSDDLYASGSDMEIEDVVEEEIYEPSATESAYGDNNKERSKYSIGGATLETLLSDPYSPLTHEDIAGLDSRELRILRNSYYARHGYIFRDEELGAYFSRYDWYHPVSRNVDNKLTEIQKRNINLIKAHESSY